MISVTCCIIYNLFMIFPILAPACFGTLWNHSDTLWNCSDNFSESLTFLACCRWLLTRLKSFRVLIQTAEHMDITCRLVSVWNWTHTSLFGPFCYRTGFLTRLWFQIFIYLNAYKCRGINIPYIYGWCIIHWCIILLTIGDLWQLLATSSMSPMLPMVGTGFWLV